MTKRSRTHAPCGGRIRPDGGWAKFVAAAQEAARAAKRAARPKHEPSPASLANLRPGRMYLVHKAPRCAAIAARTGQPCRNAAVLGSKLCVAHGGLLDTPNHPATIRVWGGEAGEQMQAAVEARKAFAKFPAATRNEVWAAFAATGALSRRRRGKWPSLLQGAQALTANDAGRSFRRWLAELQDAENKRIKKHMEVEP